MSEPKQRIIDTSMEKFFQFGFSKVTMDEIAADLRISKKTIYKYFPSKHDLIMQIVDKFKRRIRTNIETVLSNNELDYSTKLKEIMQIIAEQISQVKKPLMEDIQKNYPEIWDDIHDFRQQVLREKFGMLFQQGIEAGFIRKDIDYNLFMFIYINFIQSTLKPDVLVTIPYRIIDVFDTVFKVIFEGILTQKGRKKFMENSE